MTLGCKVNQFESAAFISELVGHRGVEIVPFSAPAEVYLINTCAVIAKAGAQCRQLIRRAAKNPEARLVITGCYAQIAPQEILELGNRPISIVGNGFKDKVVKAVMASRACLSTRDLGDMAVCRQVVPLTVSRFGRRTRAILKVQDGCSRGCSCCIVPISRGPSRSVLPKQVLAQAAIFARIGHRELVITGIHLGHYGLDLTPVISLPGLLKQLLARRFPLRYQISSLEPTEVDDELLELLAAEEGLQPHLHIPLQSGDDRILRAMNRPCRAGDFAATIECCAARAPDMAIGVDVMAGFPGEDTKAFNNTCQLLVELPISYLHVFPHSRRAGTRAATLPAQVSDWIRKQRTAILRALDQQKRREFYRRHRNKSNSLAETADAGGNNRHRG